MIHFRPGTSDERVLKEVLERRCYRKQSIGFDVEPGEMWLDLGANIGAFALYCQTRRALAECYEPDSDCFKLLKKNVPFFCINAAVTANRAKEVDFYRAQNNTDFSRGTILKINKFRPSGKTSNLYAGLLAKSKGFDGIKMDIEGAEGPILDSWLLPQCRKLVLEYHTSRDLSVKNFVRRLSQLEKHFNYVEYPPEFDRILAQNFERFERWIIAPELSKGGRFVQYPAADRLIFAWSPR